MIVDNVRYLRNFIHNALVRGGSLEAAADSVQVVQPAEVERWDRSAVFLPGQLEKATQAVPGHTTLREEIAGCLQREPTHAPVIKYTFRNALVHPSGFEAPGCRLRADSRFSPKYILEETKELPAVLYSMSAVARQFFGHWLQDACATALLQDDDEALVLDDRPDWPHAGEYIEAFGLKPETSRMIFAENLTFYQDFGQGSLKRRRYDVMRERLAQVYETGKTGPAAVYFRRGASGASRAIANENVLMEALARNGFQIVDLETSSLSSLYESFKDSRIVVSVDGSHLNHLYFMMPRGASVVTLIPADRFTANQVGYAKAAGLKYGFVVVSPDSGGYLANIPELMETIELTIG